jgi:hypothetical protein
LLRKGLNGIPVSAQIGAVNCRDTHIPDLGDQRLGPVSSLNKRRRIMYLKQKDIFWAMNKEFAKDSGKRPCQ